MIKKHSHTIFKEKKSFLNYFRPSLFISSFSQLNIQFIKRNGVKLIICDLDNTLVPHFSRIPTRPVIQFVSMVRKAGIKFVICSNNTKKRVLRFCEFLELDGVIWNAKKPLVHKVKKIINKFHLSIEEVIIIGDQVITDIFVANRLNCQSILVLPLVEQESKRMATGIVKVIDVLVYRKLASKNLLNNGLDNKLRNDLVLL